jgi:hypothetical protein
MAAPEVFGTLEEPIKSEIYNVIRAKNLAAFLKISVPEALQAIQSQNRQKKAEFTRYYDIMDIIEEVKRQRAR